jgi:bifunctional DNA-binding transcriptional regulator/antitoxin component of YhaV-PrlF toxin-antitoxin module
MPDTFITKRLHGHSTRTAAMTTTEYQQKYRTSTTATKTLILKYDILTQQWFPKHVRTKYVLNDLDRCVLLLKSSNARLLPILFIQRRSQVLRLFGIDGTLNKKEYEASLE